ncbi:CENP-S complex, centromere protein X [Corchorus olitorius]|uniref:CENP-S complex, centromere protein X n=1 Tax=Corchorus olitorius TaxID=93759 RepID=A0A1R3J388_9ROSI|nr:CENP-S complex, centromere protein X [Corchorus olitorius]
MEKKRNGRNQERNRIRTRSTFAMDESGIPTFEPDLIGAIFKHIWTRKAHERERIEILNNDAVDSEVGVAGTSKKDRPTFANANALKLSCELLRIFITEAVQRAATIAEAEGGTKIEATHLERILPQLLLDF